MDLYMKILKIPHFRTRMAVADFYERWHTFIEVMRDAWWDLRFQKRHRPIRDKKNPRTCACGYTYGDYEDAWYDHKVAAREREWFTRWDAS